MEIKFKDKYKILTGDHTAKLVFSNSYNQRNLMELPLPNKIHGLFGQESFYAMNFRFHYGCPY